MIASATLAVLALLCVALLRNRTQVDAVREVLAGVAGSQPMAGRFFSNTDNPEEIKELVLRSREVWLHGATIQLHLSSLTRILRTEVPAGLRVKILVIEPWGTAMDIAAHQSGAMTAEELSRTLEANLQRLLLPIPGDVRGSLEVRTVNYVPPYTIFAYDPAEAHGQLEMRLAQFHGDLWKRPTFRLLRSRDAHWYNFFRHHFEELWESGSPRGSLSQTP
ncbi:hypothetical protein OG898_10855 [Streptomyces sp. NBC_00193]|uniref:hypothetical protein n=1 Tax=unclassified Streptomyces TaxID=2593676 RepID=UPI002251A1A7|nr:MULTISPECIES: hypothetical protein [unclassified Streptomyces]MCX5123742.1 hypothetical protein [Streptomyces sp. NBC_00347]MCX5296988.1 hypothetical protein [Streptomyces sp. NBC_00193]